MAIYALFLIASPAANCDTRDAASCLGATTSGTSTPTRTLNWSNGGTTTAEVFAIVDSQAPNGAGTYTIGATVAVPPVGDTCSTAQLITFNGDLPGTTVGYANDYGAGTGCTATQGPDRVYGLDLPAGYLVSSTVTPTGNN